MCIRDRFEIDTGSTLDPFNDTIIIDIPGSGAQECDCPEEEMETCANTANIAFSCDDEGNITINLVSNYGSTPSSEDFLCSTDGSNYMPCPAIISGEERVFIVLDVTFEDGCEPIHLEQEISCPVNNECINSINLMSEVTDDCMLNLDWTENINSGVVSDILIVDGVSYNPASSYVPIELSGSGTIQIERTIKFDDGCADIPFSQAVDYNCDVMATEEECGNLQLTCDRVDDLFVVTYSGSDIPPKAHIDGTQIPITESGQMIEGDGLLVVVWDVPGCPQLVRTCFAKRQVEVCNLDEIDIAVEPIINFNPTINVDACCDETDCEFAGGVIQCENCLLTFVPNGDVSAWVFTWCDSEGAEVGQGMSFEAEVSGVYTLKANQEGCDEMTTEYEFTMPEAGETSNDANNPVDVG